MNFIEALLAFALLMIVFSTVASGFAEMAVRFLSLRKTNLRSMVLAFLSNIVIPHHQAETEKETTRREIRALRDKLTENALSIVRPWSLFSLGLFWNSQPWLDELSTQGFLERFAKTPEGQDYYEMADNGKPYIIDFSLSYERYLAASQELYRKTTEKVVFGVAIVLVLVANIHLGRLIEHLASNPDEVQTIIDNQDEIFALESEDDDEAKAAKLEQILDELSLPFGWEFWPYCLGPVDDSGELIDPEEGCSQQDLESESSPDAESGSNQETDSQDNEEQDAPGGDTCAQTNDCPTDNSDAQYDIPAIALWLINVLAAGILIGLGAPFWYRIAKGLGNLRAFGFSNDNESVGAAPIVHDEEGLKRAEANFEYFKKSAATYVAAQTGSPQPQDPAPEPQ